DDVYAQRTLAFLHIRGLSNARLDQVKRALPSIRERAQTFVQAADLLDPFFREPPTIDEKAAKKFLVSSAAPRLRELHRLLAESPVWDAPSLEARISTWLAEAKLELKDIGQPMRVALVGRTASPSLFEVLDLLGRDVALGRLARAADVAAAT